MHVTRLFCPPLNPGSRRVFTDIPADRRVLVQPCIAPVGVPLIRANLSHPRTCVMMRGSKPRGAVGL
jgi:hypothetical protein